MIKHYVNYLASARTAESAENIIALLKKRGQTKLLPSILRMLAPRLRRESAKEVLFIAKDADEADAKKQSGASDRVNVVTDESVLTGFVYKTPTKLIDMSGRRALINLYQRAIERTT